MIINKIYSEVVEITTKLIGVGLSIQQNFPRQKDQRISWTGEKSISYALKNISYLEKYKTLVENQEYNIKLIDGALVQLQYSFSKKGGKLRSHRLAYFPSPILERYEDVPDDYEKKYFGNSEFHDVFDEYVITFPIRFDFDNDSNKYKSIGHPYSHAHFGEFETCRIPVSSPVSPSEFMDFILRNFYNTAVKEYCNNLTFGVKNKFDSTIDKYEKKIIHIHCQ